MKVKYCGPAKDYSGYGEANRHDILALTTAGVEVSIELTRHCVEISDFGRLGEMVDKRVNLDRDYGIKLLHTTPNIFGKFIEPGKYHIGRVFWETSRLPDSFAVGAQMCDEIWTGSEFNAQAIRNAGVTKPICIVPESIDIDLPEFLPFETDADSLYKFYSIFEWTERKNPKALLEAFWREFEKTEGVALVIKTYVDQFIPEKKLFITQQIEKLKNLLNLSRYAPVYLSLDLMSRDQIYRFHRSGDCFVSAHRGEGWGIPQMEAMLMGRPIISTNRGGIHEYLVDGESAYLVSNKLINIVENSRNQQWYTPDQLWADIDISELQSRLRGIFNTKGTLARKMGEAGRKVVREKFSPMAVGTMMRKRLEEIASTIPS